MVILIHPQPIYYDDSLATKNSYSIIFMFIYSIWWQSKEDVTCIEKETQRPEDDQI